MVGSVVSQEIGGMRFWRRMSHDDGAVGAGAETGIGKGTVDTSENIKIEIGRGDQNIVRGVV